MLIVVIGPCSKTVGFKPLIKDDILMLCSSFMSLSWSSTLYLVMVNDVCSPVIVVFLYLQMNSILLAVSLLFDNCSNCVIIYIYIYSGRNEISAPSLENTLFGFVITREPDLILIRRFF
jgi:hypothetical protein